MTIQNISLPVASKADATGFPSQYKTQACASLEVIASDVCRVRDFMDACINLPHSELVAASHQAIRALDACCERLSLLTDFIDLTEKERISLKRFYTRINIAHDRLSKANCEVQNQNQV